MTVSFFFCNAKKVEWHKTDFFGRENFPSPLNPGDKAEVGMYVESFAALLGTVPSNELVLSLELKDITGYRYKLTSNFTLLLQVNEVSTNFKTTM